jgi:acyl-coenzyme A thioesterase PaaI-like protein
VCGRDNPHGLHLQLHVDDVTGVVSVDVTFSPDHVGFIDVVHGGAVATVADEAMVWAATWAGKRFCLCGEMSVRFMKPTTPGVAYRFEAMVESKRSRLITTTCRVLDPNGVEIATATAKYLPLPAEQHARVVKTFVSESISDEAATALGREDDVSIEPLQRWDDAKSLTMFASTPNLTRSGLLLLWNNEWHLADSVDACRQGTSIEIGAANRTFIELVAFRAAEVLGGEFSFIADATIAGTLGEFKGQPQGQWFEDVEEATVRGSRGIATARVKDLQNQIRVTTANAADLDDQEENHAE